MKMDYENEQTFVDNNKRLFVRMNSFNYYGSDGDVT